MAHEYRGSEWRRWELHLHTPGTKKNDNYRGSTQEEKWLHFYETISEYVGDGTDPTRAISVIAITDYLSVDNYRKVADDKRLPDCVKLVLPNVELRVLPMAKNTPINIHCIFSHDIADQLDDLFFTRLKFSGKGNTYGATRSELIRFGRDQEHNRPLPEEQAYKKGLANFIISLDMLKSVLDDNKNLRDNTIIVVSDSTGDGVSGLKDHKGYVDDKEFQLEATRRELYRFADMIFTATPSSISYFTGDGVDSEDIVKGKIGSLKPCIHGSDAHTNEKVFEPDQKRYCWVKADPTFEGLKQLMYEPKDRVHIGPYYPHEKQLYHVIDKVVIEGNEDFSEEPIYLNDKLNCIIGGKSTGKSLLLHNIALAIDETQVEEKIEKATTNVRPVPQLKVYWKDGVCSDDASEPRKIVYIPQTYLNRLSDEHEESTDVDEIVKEIIKQKEEIAFQFAHKAEQVKQINQSGLRAVNELIVLHDERKQILAEKKEIGDSAGIIAEIERLIKRSEELSSAFGITEDEIRDYNTSIQQQQSYQTILRKLQQDKETIEGIETIVKISMYPVLGSGDIVRLFDKSLADVLKVAGTEWSSQKAMLLGSIAKKNEVSLKLLTDCSAKIELLRPKIESTNEIGEISKRVTAERAKLEKLQVLTKLFDEAKRKYIDVRSVLERIFSDYKQTYSEFAKNVNELMEPHDEDFTFHVEVVFKKDRLTQKIREILNNRAFGGFEAFSLNEIKEEDFLDQKKVVLLIKAIVNESLPPKAGGSKDSVLREIFSDWYIVNYVVRIGEDGIQNMSPGNKALVLLKLLVSLAESQCPILIDQPEDDLDNRSIYDELIQFIKTKKNHRQIIAVTHNANIVLGADAELVIVANQDGNRTPNELHRFEYRGGSIENNIPVCDQKGNIRRGVLNQKCIPSHICEILEGGEQAFDLRRNKYRSIM